MADENAKQSTIDWKSYFNFLPILITVCFFFIEFILYGLYNLIYLNFETIIVAFLLLIAFSFLIKILFPSEKFKAAKGWIKTGLAIQISISSVLVVSVIFFRFYFFGPLPFVIPDFGVNPHPKPSPDVARIIDGDTFVDVIGERVRLAGIDAPESVHPGMSRQPYSLEAKSFVVSKLRHGNNKIECLPGRDKYGRKLAYIYLENGETLNQQLVENGLAKVYPEDNHPFYNDFVKSELMAKLKKLGIWSE